MGAGQRYVFLPVVAMVLALCPSPIAAEQPAGSPADTARPEANLAEPASPTEEEVWPSIKLSGSVWRMKSGIVFLKTPVGLLTLSSKTGLRDVKGSHTVTLWINGTSAVVDIRKKNDASLVHRYVSGDLRYTASDKKAVSLWTPEGEKAFSVEAYRAKLSGKAENRPITVEVDEAGTIMRFHDLQYDLQISHPPQQSSDLHMKLAGTVAKLKSGFVFLKTPIGVVTIGAKTGVRNAKVGHALTLWAYDTSMVIDLQQNGAVTPSTRFLTGRLMYASPDRKAVTLWAPEGEQTFPAERGKAILATIKEGTPITVEINDRGMVMDIRKAG